ncbi:MAG TPA: sigma-70 family RNA polymerase sigma factor [Acidobacteriota bacterium]
MSSAILVHPRTLSDAELLERCADHTLDETLWNELIARFHRRVSTVVLRVLHAGSAAGLIGRREIQTQWRDLVQEFYARLLERDCAALRRFRGPGEAGAYLVAIAANIARDFLRAWARGVAVTGSLESEAGESSLADPRPGVAAPALGAGPDAASALVVEELLARLAALLEGPERPRNLLLFKLHYVDGMTASEIAQLDGVELETSGVHSTLARMVRRLRASLHTAVSVPCLEP